MAVLPDSQSVVIAAIDVGTNSVHMVIAEVDARGFSVLATEKDMVRLGKGSRGQDHLTEGAIQRGVGALQRMVRIAQVHGASIVAVATSAVREADNRDRFVREVRQQVGIDIDIISGPEEARLISLGVGHSLNLASGSSVIIDIGGGSTEFCLLVRGRLRIAQSLKVGAVRMTEAFLPDGQVTDAGIKGLRAKVRTTVAPLGHDLLSAGYDRLILSSGTNEAIARIVANRRGGVDPVNFNGFKFTRFELDEVVDLLLAREFPRDRTEIGGLDSKRADIIVAGAVILQEISVLVGATEFEYSDAALREGVLIDAAQRMEVLAVDGLDSGLESAARLAERCSVNMDHGQHVAELASQILRGLCRSFDLDRTLERQLRAAAILAKIGNAVSYSRHHVHSHYIISNSDLTGFTHDEIESIALVARYHRKAEPRMTHPEFARLSPIRRSNVELMASILRIATGLDRSHDQCVEDLSVSNRSEMITITVRGDEKAVNNVDLNIQTAQARSQMLSEFLGEPVVIRNG
jgi:exopolyphosphatase/guanosine-5'-triphosphate,3'-diphosphate pyrophosphatase